MKLYNSEESEKKRWAIDVRYPSGPSEHIFSVFAVDETTRETLAKLFALRRNGAQDIKVSSGSIVTRHYGPVELYGHALHALRDKGYAPNQDGYRFNEETGTIRVEEIA